MKPIISSAGSDRMLFNLSPEERENPMAILEDFCNEFSPGKMREILQKDFLALLVNEKYNNSLERERLICRYQTMLKLIEACHVIAADLAGQKMIAV